MTLSWSKTRELLLIASPALESLPAEWVWRIDLRGADLTGADLNWTSYDLIAELLWRWAAGDIEKQKIAGWVLMSRRDGWCWDNILELSEPLLQPALEHLAQFVKDGDDAPAVLQKLAQARRE